jgi:multiple sugar transport system permease protein
MTGERMTTSEMAGTAIQDLPPPQTQGSNREPIHFKGAILGFLAPFAILFTLFYILPIGYALYESFFKVSRVGAFGPPRQVFGGLTQYTQVFQSNEFWSSIERVLLFFVISVPLQLGFALIFALLLDSPVLRGAKIFRISFFAPYAVPGVIAAIMWGFLYAPSLSPFKSFTERFNLLGSGLILLSIVNVVNWVYTGYNMLIIYSSLKAIPEELFEAARVDGAGQIRVAWSIKIPIVMPALILTGVFSIIGTLQLFNEPVLFRTLSSAVNSNYTPNMVVYATSNVPNYNLAAAFSVVLALATCALSFLFLKLTQRRAFV